jgi:alpha-beta hydrolase superfamily lysophospholipase
LTSRDPLPSAFPPTGPAAPFVLSATDGLALHIHRWEPETSPKAVVQIVHGLAEHGGRYARLASALGAAGYAVYAGDLRGHGRTGAGPQDLGFFAESDGWQKCLGDLGLLHRRIAADHPGLPVLLAGHSMGSFLAQQFASEHGDTLAGLVLSGSDGPPSVAARAGRWIARLERLRHGPRGRSALIHALAFGAYNKPFQPARTPFDWLSRDPAEVDRYVNDPLCGFVPTVQLWIDLLDALGRIAKPTRLARIPKSLPIRVIAGTRDPVSSNARGLARLLAAYQRAGLERVTHRFYDGARHELFNETNRDEVTRDLIAWLDQVVGSSGPFPRCNPGNV